METNKRKRKLQNHESNKRQKQAVTKSTVLKFSRTFRHYIGLPSEDYTDVNQGWSNIPYEHICSSLKASDWQTLNCISRKWTPLECGFVLHHIVPVQLSTSSWPEQHILYDTKPYLETFIDKDFVLPIQELDKLPNNNMYNNNAVWSDSLLQNIIWNKDETQKKVNNDAYSSFANKYRNLELMNSWNWNTLSPENTYGYTWKSTIPKWRHALVPDTLNRPLDVASYLGRWDGGIDLLDYSTNRNYSSGKSNNFNLIPSSLIRPMPLNYTQDDYLFFQVLVTYTSKVLVLINDVRFFPIYNDKVNLTNIIHTRNYTNNFIQRRQWSGSNSFNITSGPYEKNLLI